MASKKKSSHDTGQRELMRLLTELHPCLIESQFGGKDWIARYKATVEILDRFEIKRREVVDKIAVAL